MNTQRLTISLPDYLYDQLITLFGRGKVSGFVAEAVEKDLINVRLEEAVDPIDEIIKLKKDLPKVSQKKILAAIHKGRK